MTYSIYGSHCDGAYNTNEDRETKAEAITAAEQLQQKSDAAGYREWFTVFDREFEVYRTESHPATLYHVQYHQDLTDVYGQTMRTPDGKHFVEFTDLDEAKAAASAYPLWRIYRTYDYATAASSEDQEARAS